MLDVYFSSNKEVINFCEQLFYYNKKIELHWKVHEEWGNHLQIESKLSEMETMEKVAHAMVEVFKLHRMPDMIKGIIQEIYYYSNADEVERILDITHDMIAGEESLKTVRSKKEPMQFLYNLFFASIKENSTIHFDSIVNFRLKEFKDYLIYDVGLAIDEFKREEDHQEFVNMLREFIAKKEAKYNVIHIVQGNPFIFYKPNGKKITKLELRKLMQEEPLYIVGLDGDEFNLAPLVAMSPKKIKIYGDYPSEPKTLTVINVFQERVDFEPYSKFPFSINRSGK
ncbi:putative sporulation protein YtxC [Ornithinibacillus halophilus]|uniref:Putative sporulation protein YtxC n=1 Tax=Ornithinibacillus halophilus TaxID=930117 RepID=A0A1M5J031_9BACI|nr:putative sporulation protein YtxC [Ornithinibacillus halophilus]